MRNDARAAVQKKKPGLAFALFSGLLCLDPEEEESARHGLQVTPMQARGLCSFPHRGLVADYWRRTRDARRKEVPIHELVEARRLNYRTMPP